MSKIIRNGLISGRDKAIKIDTFHNSAESDQTTPVHLRDDYQEFLKKLEDDAYKKGIKKAEAESKKELNQKLEDLEVFYNEEAKKNEEKLEEALKQLGALKSDLSEKSESIHAELEENTIALVFKILYKLGCDKQIHESIILQSIERELKRYTGDKETRILIPSNSGMYEVLKKLEDEDCKIIEENSLATGEYYIEHGFSVTEIGILTYLDQLREEFIRLLKDGNNEL